MKGTLYLIPSALGADAPVPALPPIIAETIGRLRYFIVEDIRTARRFLKKTDPGIAIDGLSFGILNEHTLPAEIPALLTPLLNGIDAGLLSEAGLPCVADPGSAIVKLAHENGLRVVPLSGPSSIFLALMASGFNGQNFVFHGYLPAEKHFRERKIKELETAAWQKDQTQIFIETPYRNNQLMESLIRHCKPETWICIASDLTLPGERIISAAVSEWQAKKPVDLNKKPAVFLIYKDQ